MNEQPRKWHVERTVSVGHIITTLSVAATVIIGWKDIDKRVAIVEWSSAQQKEIDARQDAANQLAFEGLRSDLRDINQKLDRIIERGK